MSFSRYKPEEETYFKQQLQRATDDATQSYNESKTKAASQKQIDDVTYALAQRKALDKANKSVADYNAGIVDPEEAKAKAALEARANEANMTDFQRYSQKNDYDLNNQQKAWESANTLRMKEADQSNVAQKDRLVSQLDNQKNMQQAGFSQTNKLRTDDNRRAIDGFKMNF
jgi:hypothetical protein